MGEYAPLATPGQTWTVTLSAATVGGQLLYVTGNGTVGPTGAAANKAVFVAAYDGAAGDQITAYGRGAIHRLTASGAVTAGDSVEPAAAGAVATHTNGTNDVNVVGLALTTATSGNSVQIMEV